MPLHAHPLVMETARKMAAELFEAYALVNDIYAQFKANGGTEKRARAIFVARVAPRLFEKAREALADVLAGDYPDSTKRTVHEALVKDNLMRANRTVSESVATVPKELMH